MIQDLRSEFQLPKLPVVAGQLGEFYLQSKRSASADRVNAALIDLPNRVEHTACVSTKGLDHKGDRVHFNAKALGELGRRYAAAMLGLEE